MIRDATARRSTITNANLLVGLCHGKVSINIVSDLCLYVCSHCFHLGLCYMSNLLLEYLMSTLASIRLLD